MTQLKNSHPTLVSPGKTFAQGKHSFSFQNFIKMSLCAFNDTCTSYFTPDAAFQKLHLVIVAIKVKCKRLEKEKKKRSGNPLEIEWKILPGTSFANPPPVCRTDVQVVSFRRRENRLLFSTKL